MADEWQFWRDALAGKSPETTPGTPHAGYFMRRVRKTYRRENPKPGDPRKRVETSFEPCAIWKDDAGWHCVINAAIHIADIDAIDEIFSRCCRTPLPYEKYIELTMEIAA